MARVRIPIVALAGNAPIAGASMQVRNRDTAAVVPVYVSETGAAVLTAVQQVSDAFGRFPGWTDAPLPLEATVTPPGGSGLAPWVEAWDAAPAGPGDVAPPWIDLSTIVQGLTSTLATRPAPAGLPNGVAFTSSDFGGQWLAFAGAWVPVGAMRGTLAQRNAIAAGNLIAGDQFEATDDWGGTLYRWTGAAWAIVWSRNVKTIDLAAQASGTFANLDGDTDREYELEYMGTGVDTGGGAPARLRVFPNNDRTAANYQWIAARDWNQVGTGTGTDRVSENGAEAGVTIDYPISGTAGAAVVIHSKCRISALSGKRRLFVFESGRDARPATVFFSAYHGSGTWTNTATNIASLVVEVGAGTLTGRLVLRRLPTA